MKSSSIFPIDAATGSTGNNVCLKFHSLTEENQESATGLPQRYSYPAESQSNCFDEVDDFGFSFNQEQLHRYKAYKSLLKKVEIPEFANAALKNCVQDIQELIVSKKSFHNISGGAKSLLIPEVSNSIVSAVKQVSDPSIQTVGLLLGTPSQMIMWPPTDTDGPAGCFALAHVLVGMGKKVVILTDETHYGQVHPAFLRSRLRDPMKSDWGRNVTMKQYPVGEDWEDIHDNALELTYDILDHIINVGRLGPASDSEFYANTGYCATEYETRFFKLFSWAEESKKTQKPVYTTAIGEIGNELGMAPVRKAMVIHSPNNLMYSSVHAADNVIVSVCVNWGAFGLAAALALHFTIEEKIKGREMVLGSLLPTAEENQNVLITLVDEAARCGISGARDLWVDRHPLKKQAKMIDRINDTAEYYYSTIEKKLISQDCIEKYDTKDGKSRVVH